MADREVLAVDVGGSNVKVLLSGDGHERRRFASGPELTPAEMVEGVVGSDRRLVVRDRFGGRSGAGA